MSFQQFSLHPQVLAGVKSVGFIKPTPIQQQAIPAAMAGRDLMGLAQTGTGKTAAFALPILHHLATTPAKRGVRCLVIAPTRELAEQIHQAFDDLGQHLGVKSIAIYGGVSKGPQLAGLRRGAQVVIACPGRLLDHVDQKDINLSGVEILVLDEADTMCDMGFLPDVRRILDHVPAKRQTLFFSATMPDEIRSLAMKILKDPELVQIGSIAPAKTVSHSLYPVPDKLKKNLLLALLQKTPTGRALVFTRTKHRARQLALDLAKRSFRVAALQGNMSQNARQQAMDGFRAGKFDILVATDIAAHGIDVPDVSHVINFDFPNTTDTYTHRIGRTGRAEQTGEAFTLAIAEDSSMVREVEKELGLNIERRRLEGFDYGGFTPEDQFQEKRNGQGHATSPRNSRSTNGGRPRQNTQNGNGGGPRQSAQASNGGGPRQSAQNGNGGGPRDNAQNGNSDGSRERNPRRDAGSAGASGGNGRRSEQPVSRTTRTDSTAGRTPGQMLGRTSRAGSSTGRRSDQPAGGKPPIGHSDGTRTGQLLGRVNRTGPANGRNNGQLLGKTTRTGSSNGNSAPRAAGGMSRTNSANEAPKKGGPSSFSRPARPGSPRRRSTPQR